MNKRSDAIRNTLKRLALEYADDPNVQTIGFGLPSRGGEIQMARAIIFYVHRKYPTDRQIEAAGSEVIPPEIDGLPTDVQPFDVHASAAGNRDESQFDPLLGGVMSSNADGHIYWFNVGGTLGILVRDAADGTPMALSNWHVWGDGGEEGDDIIQPGHPTAGDHVEGIVKIGACGPLLTSLIQWEVPSPLTLGLYGGAAAAAVAAAASDYRDPTRRGQDLLPTNPGELTTGETVEMRIDYPDLPLPGVPFATDVEWRYERRTADRVLTHTVVESRVNTQFLLGKLVVTDKPEYMPGETVRLTAAVWDYQPRPCDGYHVVAHLIPHARPTEAIRAVLHPSACPRTFPQRPPDRGNEEPICMSFGDQRVGTRPNQGSFGWLNYVSINQQPIQVVDWFAPIHAVLIPQQPLVLSHEPASRVIASVAQLTDSPVALLAYNSAGVLLVEGTAPAQQAVVHELTLHGTGIVQVVVRGGGGEGLLISYCIEPEVAEDFAPGITPALAAGIRAEIPAMGLDGDRIRARRCCFTGSVRLPPEEPAGQWDVHLTVQNVNPTPAGTPPDQAATTIGGHLLSSHTSAEVLACTAVMLLDRAFDVI